MIPKHPSLAAASSHSVSPYFWVLLLVLLSAALILCMSNANAESVGTVKNLSEPSQLLAKRANGDIQVLVLNSEIRNGDLLETQGNTYARIKFKDDSEITLSPNTKFKVDNYAFNADQPKEDRSVFTLLKGTLRSITSKLGQRSKDSYQLKTPDATIGIRGTNYLAKYVPGDGVAPCPTEKQDKDKGECDNQSGLWVEVVGGSIIVSNDKGSQVLDAGQFGYVASNQIQPMLITSSTITFNPQFNKVGTIQCTVK